MRRGRLFLAFAVAFFACVVTWRAEAGFGPAQGSSGGLGGVVLTGTPSAGKVPTATSATTATWQTPAASGWSYTSPKVTLATSTDQVGIGATPSSIETFNVTASGNKNINLIGGTGGFGVQIYSNSQNSFLQVASSSPERAKAVTTGDLTLEGDNSVTIRTINSSSVAAVWSGTLETRLGGTIAQPTQVSQAASVTLNTTAAYWNANSSGAQTFTLPDATACAGRVYSIKNVNTGTLTIATTSSQKIDGGTSLTVSTQYQSYTLVSDGVQWWIY